MDYTERWSWTRCASLYKSAASFLFFFFTPSFLHKSQKSTATANNRLAAIEGVRGMACIIIFNGHVCEALLHQIVWNGGKHWYQYPILHMFMSGRSMVWIFWVIAGYTSALKPLKQLSASHSGTSPISLFYKSLSSTMVRRPFRLFLPPLGAMLLTVLVVRAGLAEPSRHIRMDTIHGVKNYYKQTGLVPDRQSNLFLQLMHMLRAFNTLLVSVFSKDSVTPDTYDDDLWCIPVQYKCALMMALVLLAASRMRPRFRTTFIASLVVLSVFYWQKVEYIAHFGGMLLADVDVRLAARATQSRSTSLLDPSNEKARPPRPYTRALYFLSVVLGMFLLSISLYQPEQQAFIGRLIRNIHYIYYDILGATDGVAAIGAIFFAHGVIHCELFHALFCSPVMLYLGKISFSFYVIHGPLVKTILGWTLPAIYHVVGTEGPMSTHKIAREMTNLQSVAIYAMIVVPILPLTIWVADVFYRAVELNASRVEFWVDCVVTQETC